MSSVCQGSVIRMRRGMKQVVMNWRRLQRSPANSNEYPKLELSRAWEPSGSS
jgi:hypothetical protein